MLQAASCPVLLHVLCALPSMPFLPSLPAAHPLPLPRSSSHSPLLCPTLPPSPPTHPSLGKTQLLSGYPESARCQSESQLWLLVCLPTLDFEILEEHPLFAEQIKPDKNLNPLARPLASWLSAQSGIEQALTYCVTLSESLSFSESQFS